jgi:hypothetical protein
MFLNCSGIVSEILKSNGKAITGSLKPLDYSKPMWYTLQGFDQYLRAIRRRIF